MSGNGSDERLVNTLVFVYRFLGDAISGTCTFFLIYGPLTWLLKMAPLPAAMASLTGVICVWIRILIRVREEHATIAHTKLDELRVEFSQQFFDFQDEWRRGQNMSHDLLKATRRD